MALKWALVSSSTNIFLCVPRNDKSCALYPTLLPAYPRADIKRLHFYRSLKCLVDYRYDYYYNNHHHHDVVEYAKPAEIPWNKDLCNVVHLIGNVGTAVETKQLPSGKVVAWTRLAVWKSARETTWINLTFWDELAQVASQHVQKGHQIYVTGRLVSDIVENDDGKQQTFYKVVVQKLNFVERNSVSSALNDHDSGSMIASGKFGNNAANGKVSTGELWQAFFASPLEWWDNRKNKRNPKYPDFKHKDTGEALWVEGRYNPPWVKSQLAILDERMGSLRDQDNGAHVNSIACEDFMPL